jgi:hypothetical protein
VPDPVPVPEDVASRIEAVLSAVDALSARIDILGAQMNWLVDNLTSLFGFVNQMSQSGGGIRGMLHAMKQGAPPELNSNVPKDTESKVESNV